MKFVALKRPSRRYHSRRDVGLGRVARCARVELLGIRGVRAQEGEDNALPVHLDYIEALPAVPIPDGSTSRDSRRTFLVGWDHLLRSGVLMPYMWLILGGAGLAFTILTLVIVHVFVVFLEDA